MTELFADLPDQPTPQPASRGEPRLIHADRRQMELRATTLDELIGEDHLARLVWAMVQRFDFAPLLEAVEAREGKPGHPQTDPAILAALWLYATLDGVGSARELARLCDQHAAYRWLCGGVSTNHHTLSDFRVGHADWLDAQLVRGITSLMAAGEVELATVAQDGMRVRAAAGGSSFRRRPRLADLRAKAEARVAALKPELDTDPTRRSRQQAAAERVARERLARVEAALAAMPQAQQRKKRNKGNPAEARVSTTDAEAHMMKMPDGGFRPAYNVQFAAETRHGLITAVAVDTSGGDQAALEPVHATIMQSYGRAPANYLVDGGFVSQHGIETLTARGSKVHAPLVAALDKRDSPALAAWRSLMQSEAGKALYRLRGQTIEWVNAGARNQGLYAVNVRGKAKVRGVVLWHALAHNLRCTLRVPSLARAVLLAG
jgi:transposase